MRVILGVLKDIACIMTVRPGNYTGNDMLDRAQVTGVTKDLILYARMYPG
jgi:hypothetical protein